MDRRFITMDDITLHQFLSKVINDRSQIIFTTADNPIRHGGTAETDSCLFSVLFLSVKRNAVYVFLIHDTSNRSRCICFSDKRTIFVLAGRAFTNLLHISYDSYLGWYIFKFIPNLVKGDLFHIAVTLFSDNFIIA